MVQMTEKQLAIVLLDIIGSTAFVERMGARKSAEWLQYHDRLTRSLLYKFNGREIDRSDGFMLSFDRCIDAVNFALWYQRTIPPKTKLQTRIGIHWGVVVEILQDERYTLSNAKAIELEGIAKNVTARTMSLCQPRQVLLTREAFRVVRNRTNRYTPSSIRFACVGLYRFKGVSVPQEIYAVGESIEVLQPPPSTDKVKRVGGVRKIRSRARDRKLREWVEWGMPRLALFIVIWLTVLAWPALSSSSARRMWGIDYLFWWVDYVNLLFNEIGDLM